MVWMVIEPEDREEVHVVPDIGFHELNQECKCGLVIEQYDIPPVIHQVVQ